jgi:hypothetical protein
MEEEEHKALKDTTNGLVKDTAAVLDKKHKELIKSRNETESAKKKIVELETELRNLKLGELKHGLSVINCEKCDISIETHENLKRHIIMQYQSRNKSSQYENCRIFEQYG